MSKSVLKEADEIVTLDRQEDYGHPWDNMLKIAELWSPILGMQVTPEQVALCMIQVKIAREVHKPKRDNLVDLAGYTKVLEMVIERRTQMDKNRAAFEETMKRNEALREVAIATGEPIVTAVQNDLSMKDIGTLTDDHFGSDYYKNLNHPDEGEG